MRRKKNISLVYKPKALIAGYKIEAGLTGFYVGVPDKNYKGNSFTIKYFYQKANAQGEYIYALIEKKVDDWNRAEHFRRFMDKWGRGAYTLGYFKVAEEL